MPVENTNFIGSLDSALPTGTDLKSQGDDHLRLIKKVLKQCFAGFQGEVMIAATESQGTTVNDYLLTIAPAIGAYATNTMVVFRATHANTGGATLRIGGLSIKALLTPQGTALRKNAILANTLCVAIYDGTSFRLLVGNSQAIYDYVDQFAFSTALPAQEGNGSKTLTTDGEIASWVFADVLKRYGPDPTGTLDSTAQFALLESLVRAQKIDLLGGTYSVTSMPNGNDYYNGAFKLNGDVIWRAQNPRSNPFDAPVATVRPLIPEEGKYRGLNAGILPIGNTSNWVVVWRESVGHAVEDGTSIMAADTDDCGQTLSNIRLIFRTSTADSRNFVSGVMGNGRIGIMTARPQAAGTYLDPAFIFSDDGGRVWASINVPFPSNIDFHGRIYPWPAVAGGHDTLGFIAYGYRPTSQGGGICALTTVNNGSTWQALSGIVLPDTAFPNLSELAVSRLGTSNRWVMAIRTSTGLNLAVSTSVNMTDWAPVKDSGLFLSSNPPELFYEDGKFWLLSFSRRGRELIPQYGNAVVVSEADAEKVYASGGTEGFRGWKIMTACMYWPTGYISMQNIRGRYYGLFTMGEDQPGNSVGRTGYLGLLSSDSNNASNPRQLFASVARPNLLLNGSLQLWQAGTTFNNFAQRRRVADGFTFARTAFAAGATVSRINGIEAQYALRIRRDDGDASTSSLNLTIALAEQDCIPLRLRPVTMSFRIRTGSGFSANNGFLATQVRQSGAAEQIITSASGLFSTDDRPVDTSSTGVNVDALYREYRVSVGNVAADARQLLIRFSYTPTGVAMNDYFDIERIKLEPGRVATPFPYEPIDTLTARARRVTQVQTVRTVNGTRWISFGAGMRRLPEVSATVGTVSNITVDGCDLTHTASVDSVLVIETGL